MEIQSSRLRLRLGPDRVIPSCCSTRTGADGTFSTSVGAWPRSLVPNYSAISLGPTSCRPPSRPATPGPSAPRNPTGRGLAALYGELAPHRPVADRRAQPGRRRLHGFGTACGALTLVDQLRGTGTLERYHLLYSVRGDLLDRLGRGAEAAAEFERAASLATNA